MWLVLVFTVLFVLLVGTITDFKTREIPDWLTYGGVVAGLGLRLIWSAHTWDYVHIAEGAVGFLVFFGIACALYYLGQWGGGDSKALMAIGACLGINLDFNHIILAFVVNAIWIGGIYGFFWSVFLAVKNLSRFWKEFRARLHTNGKFRIIPLAILLFLAILSFFVKFISLFWSIIIFLIVFMAVFYYLTIFIRTVEKVAMLKFVPVSRLTEGEWIAKDVVINKKHICGPKDLGISEKQITELKKLKVKKVLIKIGIPFVPALLLAYLFTLFLGNPLFWLV